MAKADKRARQRQRRQVREAATGTPVLESIRTDLIGLDEGAVRTDGTVPIKVISPGWGTSGYYSAEVLEAAGTDRVWPAGTHMYWDHPTEGERPERSLRNLAAVLETDAVWSTGGTDGPGLYATAKVFEAFRPLVAELAPHIGVSVRAGAEMSLGEAEGKRGRIVERIVNGESIDFVTKAGRGGQILAVLEAAGRTDLIEEARNSAEWFQSRVHLDFTTRADDMFGEGRLTKDERIALSNAIGKALDAFNETVTELAPQLYERDPWADVPAPTTTSESQEDHMDKKELEEAVAAAVDAKVATLQEANTKLTTDLDEATQRGDAAEERARRAEEALLVKSAAEHVAANDKVKGLPAVTRTRLVESLSKGAVATEDGKLDVAKLDEAITAAVDAEVAYLTEATGSPITGVGGDGGFGGSDDKDSGKALEESFKRLGLSEDAAKLAAAGRGAR